MERLNRVLASAGIASRRRAEELILEGRVRVDGQIVTELGTKVDLDTQKVEVDGKLIPSPRRRYILLNKPSGYITTTSDERSRHTVMELVPVGERVVPVGRLDRQTEGLLLLTNDGEVAHRVMHPRFEIDKEYEALLDGYPPPDALDRLRRGITIDGERARPEMVRPIRNTEDGTIVRIIIHEGRNRIVRRMFDEIGYPVLRLVRTRIGPLQLGAIPRGTFRDLTDGELRALREALHLTDEDVTFGQRTADRPLRDRPDPERMRTGRPRVDTSADRSSRGRGVPQRPRRDGERTGLPRQRRDDDRRGPPQPHGGRYPGRPQTGRDREDTVPARAARRADDQRSGRPGRPPDRPDRWPTEPNPDQSRPPRRPRRRDDERPARKGSLPPRANPLGDERRERRPGPRRGGPPRGPGRSPSGGGPGGSGRDAGSANKGVPTRRAKPGPGGERRQPKRDEDNRESGGGGERPPVDDRDRRPGSGRQEHGRGDRRPED